MRTIEQAKGPRRQHGAHPRKRREDGPPSAMVAQSVGYPPIWKSGAGSVPSVPTKRERKRCLSTLSGDYFLSGKAVAPGPGFFAPLVPGVAAPGSELVNFSRDNPA